MRKEKVKGLGWDLQLVRQAEGDNVWPHGDRYILLVVEHIGHGRGMRRLVGLETPEWLAGLRIRGSEGAVICAIKDHTPGSAEHPAKGISGASLRKLPRWLAGLDVECAQDPLARIGWIGAVGAAHVSVA